MCRYFDWSEVLAITDTEMVTETFSSIVRDAINTFVPQRIFKPSIYPEWFSKDLKTCFLKKHHFHRLFKPTVNTLLYTQFSTYCALPARFYATDKRSSPDQRERSLNQSPKDFWRFANQHTRDTSQIICLSDHSQNDSYVSAPVGVAEMLADYFSDCCSTAIKLSGLFVWY